MYVYGRQLSIKKSMKKPIPTLRVWKNSQSKWRGRERGWKGKLLLNYPAEWLHVIKKNQEYEGLLFWEATIQFHFVARLLYFLHNPLLAKGTHNRDTFSAHTRICLESRLILVLTKGYITFPITWLAGKPWLCHGQHFFSHGSFECHLETENTAVKGSYLISAKESYHSCFNLTVISLCLFIARFIRIHLAALINLFSFGGMVFTYKASHSRLLKTTLILLNKAIAMKMPGKME